MSRLVRVVKVGGSLLDLESLPESLTDWLQRQGPATHVLIAGGGPFADVVRQVDRLHRIGEEFGHWFCISLMGLTARLMAELLSGSRLIEDYEELTAALEEDRGHAPNGTHFVSGAARAAQCEPTGLLEIPGGSRRSATNMSLSRAKVSPMGQPPAPTSRSIVFAVESYLRRQEPVHPGPKVIHNWHSTSDAIAARLALSIGAAELVLLKSTALPEGISRADAADLGLVDASFPTVSGTLAVRWVNLRASEPDEAQL